MALKLLVRNTLEHILVDPKHWAMARDIHWEFKDGRVRTPQGDTYESLCGSDFRGMKNSKEDPYDKQLSNLIPKNKRWIYSEYYCKMVLV